jgi:dihydropteroate synthase
MRTRFTWSIGKRKLELGKRTLVMGIVNVTPDSFSDGARYFDRGRAVEHALKLLEEGADLIDIGGESTRPGAVVLGSGHQPTVSPEEELRRVIPVIAEVKTLKSKAVISVDTYKAEVARAAVEAGAEIVNDVSGFLWDTALAPDCAEMQCGVVLMHMRGNPETWRSLPPLRDPLKLVKSELKERAEHAIKEGVERNRVVLDPGLGFGKRLEENYPVLAGLHDLQELGFPLLVGASRKSFVGRAIAGDDHLAPVGERLYGSIAATTIAVLSGAHIVRVHDVKESVEAVRVIDSVMDTSAHHTSGRPAS